MSWSWNPVQRSLKVIGIDMYWSATYNFLLTFHSNHGPISYRFRDKRRFQSKMAHFSHPCIYCAPADWVSFGVGYRRNGSKSSQSRWPWLIHNVLTGTINPTGPNKKFDDIFSRGDTIHQRDRRTDGRTDTGRHQRSRFTHSVARVKTNVCVMYLYLYLYDDGLVKQRSL